MEKVLSAISDCGWHYEPPNLDSHPLPLQVFKGQESVSLLIYIWNVTHGGRTRSDSEYRIQITPDMTIDMNPPNRTLLLGYYEQDGNAVFVGFDPAKHQSPGASASIQIKLETLEKAIQDGLAIQEKAREGDRVTEVAVAFRPEVFMDYATQVYPDYHVTEITTGEIIAVTRRPEEIIEPTKEEIVPKERQRAIGRYSRIQRDATFSLRVLHAYGWKCTVCGIQLRLVEAAHIIPVGVKGSTDETKNGLALCPTHHRAYDKGLVGIDADLKILVNETRIVEFKEAGLAGNIEEFKKWSRVGEEIFPPSKPSLRPDQGYLRRGLQIRRFPSF